jgi:hypothetical protein
MSGDLVFRFLLGHLFGDYLFQNNWMALQKKHRTLPCLTHCLIWTGCVTLSIWPELVPLSLPRILWTMALLCLSHFLLDRTDIINWWLRTIRSRSWEEMRDIYSDAERLPLEKHALTSYTALVQTVADNTLHLAFVYAIVRFLVLPCSL